MDTPRVKTDLSHLAQYRTFPFDLPVSVRPMAPREDSEPPRSNEDPATCASCAAPESDYVWTDRHWRMFPVRESFLPGIVIVETREHFDSFADLPDDLAAEFGPLCGRVERALLSLGGIGRVHLYRWGDGSGHFHVWFYPRPFGQLQLRGSFITAWDPLLEPVSPEEIAEAGRTIARAMG
ncbi:MAG TPA: hypothetical protein VKB69_04370 [Micromonosporaceae bacterium]|nr:hypothetical protein [Micromonosporaceae bacterium]